MSSLDRAAIAITAVVVLAAVAAAALFCCVGNPSTPAPVPEDEAAEIDSFSAAVVRRDSAYAHKFRRKTYSARYEAKPRHRQQYNEQPSGCYRERAAAPVYPTKLHAGETVDLNCGDTTELRHVPGVGSVIARRIVRYGESLGGYVSAAQAAEVYGLDSSVVRWFVVSSPAPQKININRAAYARLARHPYIGGRRAAYILQMRREWGRIRSLRALLNDTVFSPADAKRLAPYVEF